MAALSADNHNRVQQLCLQYEKANDDTKNVFIRDELDNILAPIMMQWRCLPHEVGIHPCNRDRALMSFKGNAKVESTSSTYDAPQGSSSAGKRKATQAEKVSKKQKAKPGQEGVSKQEKK